MAIGTCEMKMTLVSLNKDGFWHFFCHATNGLFF